MPPRRLKVSRKKRRNGRRTNRPPLANATSGGPNSSSLLFNGVKQLLSLIPGVGSILPKLADMIFISLSYTDKAVELHEPFYAITETYGVMGTFVGMPVNFLAGAPNIRVYPDSDTGRGKVELGYREFRLLELNILVKLDNRSSKRSGRLGFGFVPYHTQEQQNQFTSEAVVDLRTLMTYPYKRMGTTSQTLRLRFVPRPADGWIFNFRKESEPIFALVVVFQDENRTSYKKFEADDLSFDVRVQGRLLARTPTQDRSIFTAIDKSGINLPKSQMIVQTIGRPDLIHFVRDISYEDSPIGVMTRATRVTPELAEFEDLSLSP